MNSTMDFCEKDVHWCLGIRETQAPLLIKLVARKGFADHGSRKDLVRKEVRVHIPMIKETGAMENAEVTRRDGVTAVQRQKGKTDPSPRQPGAPKGVAHSTIKRLASMVIVAK